MLSFDIHDMKQKILRVRIMEVRRSKFTLIATKFLAAALVLLLSLCIGRAANVWDAGGGGNRSINNAANWDNDIVPVFDGTQVITFGVNGTLVNLNVPVNVSGLILNRNASMTFTPLSVANFFSTGSSGILAQPTSDASVTYDFLRSGSTSPIQLVSNQVWTVQNQASSTTILRVDGIGGDYNLTKSGSGILALTSNASRSNSSFSMTLDGGVLRLHAGSALNTSASAPLFLNGGELRLFTNTNTAFNGTNITVGGDASITTSRASGSGAQPVQSIGPISIGDYTLTVRDANVVNSTGDAVLQTGAVTLTGNAVFNVVNTDNAGVLKLGTVGQSGGAMGFTKSGNGTLELTADSSYSGNTTVTAGTLLANANATSTTVNVQSGGTLGGNGTVGGVVLETGGTLAPGNSPGMLSVSGDATWQGGASYNWQVQALNSGPSQLSKGINWDFFSVNGTLNLSGLNTTPLNFNLFNPLNLNFQPGNSWAIAESMQGIRLNGGLLAPNTDYSSLFNINSTSVATLQIVTLADYNTLYLISAAVIPEPSQVAASLLLVSFAAGYWILKKRREARKITTLRQSPPVA